MCVCVWKFNPTAAYKNSFILKCWIICQLLGIWQYLGSHLHLSKVSGLCCLSSWAHTSAKPVQMWGIGGSHPPEVKEQVESPWLQDVSRELRRVRSWFCSAVVFPVKGGKTDTCKTFSIYSLVSQLQNTILGGGFSRIFASRACSGIAVSGWVFTKYA